MPAAPAPGRKTAGSVHLLYGSVPYALVDESHVHHAPARQWFSSLSGGFATCPITRGALLHLAMRLGGDCIEQALILLGRATAHPKHHFWPDTLPNDKVRWQGVMGHRQVTDAYLASMARHHKAKLVSFDKGLVALHPDVGVAVDAKRLLPGSACRHRWSARSVS